MCQYRHAFHLQGNHLEDNKSYTPLTSAQHLVVSLGGSKGSVNGSLEGGDGGSISSINLGLDGGQESISVGLQLLDIAQDEGCEPSGSDDGGLFTHAGEVSELANYVAYHFQI